MERKKNESSLAGILKHPVMITFSILVAGTVGWIGTWNADVKYIVEICRPAGKIYLYLLQMTVIPILVSAIVSSVAGMVKSASVGKFVARLVVILVLFLVVSSGLGIAGGFFGKPGSQLPESTKDTLGTIINESEYQVDLEVSLSEKPETPAEVSFADFIVRIIPQNIFLALAGGRALELVFFAIIFGIAIGMLRNKNGEYLISLFEGFFRAFQGIVNWLMYLLPIGLFFLISDQIVSTGFGVLQAMMKFIIVFFVIGIGLITLNTIIIWVRSRRPLGDVLKATADPIVLCLATRSSFAALPYAIKSMEQDLDFDETTTKLFLPLGITLGRFGNIIYFSLAAFFVAQLYGAALSMGQIGFILVASILAGIGTAGSTGVATLQILSLVLSPLGLPLEAILIIFIAIDTVIDPLRTLLIVHTNMAANALISHRKESGQTAHDSSQTEKSVSRELPPLLERAAVRGELVVAIRKGESALYLRRSNGKPAGVGYDLAARIAREAGIKALTFREFETFEEIEAALELGTVDLCVRWPGWITDTDSVVISQPYFSTQRALGINKAVLGNRNITDFLKNFSDRIGVVPGTVHNVTLKKVIPRGSAVEYGTEQDMVQDTIDGRIPVCYTGEIFLKAFTKQSRDSSSGMVSVVLRNTEDADHLAVASAHRDSLSFLNRVIGVRPDETAAADAFARDSNRQESVYS